MYLINPQQHKEFRTQLEQHIRDAEYLLTPISSYAFDKLGVALSAISDVAKPLPGQIQKRPKLGHYLRGEDFGIKFGPTFPGKENAKEMLRAIMRFYCFVAPDSTTLSACAAIGEPFIDFVPGEICIVALNLKTNTHTNYTIKVLDLLLASNCNRAIAEFARFGFLNPALLDSLFLRPGFFDAFHASWSDLHPDEFPVLLYVTESCFYPGKTILPTNHGNDPTSELKHGVTYPNWMMRFTRLNPNHEKFHASGMILRFGKDDRSNMKYRLFVDKITSERSTERGDYRYIEIG